MMTMQQRYSRVFRELSFREALETVVLRA